MKRLVLLTFLFLTALFVPLCIGANIADSPTITLELLKQKQDWTPSSIKNMISFVAREYDYKEKPLLWLAEKESSYRYSVVGDSGLANGIYQYHKPTWESFQEKYGLEELDINNPVDQVIMTIFALKDNQHKHWTPYLTNKNAPK